MAIAVVAAEVDQHLFEEKPPLTVMQEPDLRDHTPAIQGISLSVPGSV